MISVQIWPCIRSWVVDVIKNNFFLENSLNPTQNPIVLGIYLFSSVFVVIFQMSDSQEGWIKTECFASYFLGTWPTFLSVFVKIVAVFKIRQSPETPEKQENFKLFIVFRQILSMISRKLSFRIFLKGVVGALTHVKCFNSEGDSFLFLFRNFFGRKYFLFQHPVPDVMRASSEIFYPGNTDTISPPGKHLRQKN